MTEAAVPIVDQAVRLCSRGEHPLGNYYHVGWDPKGPICNECWYAEVDQAERARQAEEWAEFYEQMKECQG